MSAMSSMNRRTLLGHAMSGLTLVIAFVMFFPILWMVMTSFKTEADAFTYPPLLVFTPTFENYANALQGSRYFDSLLNTGVIVLFSTLLALTLGVPAAYSLAYYPTKRSNFTLSWVMSTRMLPAVGVVVPLYVIFKNLGLFDTHLGLILLYTTANLPLVIWMMHSFLSDLPYEILEAGRMDGATLWQEFFRIILPLSVPGLVSTVLLCLIFTWNEFFLAFNLTINNAAPLSVFIVSFKTSEGLFWAKMSAAATITALPVVIAGWVSQRQLVRGLTAGAVK
jgi:sorbitol/mannitol transport system permease protein